MNKDFMQVDKQNDETSEFLNNLFASEGQRLMRQLDDANFNAGVADAKRGLAPAKQWCKPYRAGYLAHQATMAAVAEMVTAGKIGIPWTVCKSCGIMRDGIGRCNCNS